MLSPQSQTTIEGRVPPLEGDNRFRVLDYKANCHYFIFFQCTSVIIVQARYDPLSGPMQKIAGSCHVLRILIENQAKCADSLAVHLVFKDLR